MMRRDIDVRAASLTTPNLGLAVPDLIQVRGCWPSEAGQVLPSRLCRDVDMRVAVSSCHGWLRALRSLLLPSYPRRGTEAPSLAGMPARARKEVGHALTSGR